VTSNQYKYTIYLQVVVFGKRKYYYTVLCVEFPLFLVSTLKNSKNEGVEEKIEYVDHGDEV
jgi:hypothetical protein